MARSLVIVESPTKAKTLSKYFGHNYQALASVGHLKDLTTNWALTSNTASTVLSQKLDL
ncbi:MAG TPA: toprim domain-containing protein [Nitrospirales bacterium]|nr:hypothetical protein [Nitrospiraceae bacterium]HNP31566.1 toprim domain-containing protein [Nitrospirales bacterium]